MARKKKSASRSAFIRNEFAKNSNATAKVVQDAWKKAGSSGELSPSLISIVKAGMGLIGGKKKKVTTKKKMAVVRVARKKKRRGRPAAKRRGRPTTPKPAVAASGGSFSLSDISAAKALVSQIGGTAKAKSLLDVLG